MADDALTEYLKAAKLTDAQRAGLWDLYQASKNEDDLAERLKPMQLPDELKAGLWDLKAGRSSAAPVERTTKPSDVFMFQGHPRFAAELPPESDEPSALQRMAHPQSLGDFVNLGMAAMQPAFGPIKTAKEWLPAASNFLDRLGMAVEKGGAEGIVKTTREAIGGAIGRTMQAGSRVLSGAPDEVGMIQQINKAAASRAVKLTEQEAGFIGSIGERLSSGSSLTVPQKAWLKSIYYRKIAP